MNKYFFRATLVISLLALIFFGGMELLKSDGISDSTDKQEVDLPILMYHHIDENAVVDTMVTPETFESQIATLAKAGYTAVTGKQVLDFVENGGDLPEKPIWITFDDGYTSNLEYAAPILEKYNMCATIFVIGVYAGKSYYANVKMDPPRFALSDVKSYVDEGVFEVQSHTYDMHERVNDGINGRDGVLQEEGEAFDIYKDIFENDINRAREQLKDELGMDLFALAYPYGFHSSDSEEMLSELGIQITLTTKHGINHLVRGDASTLRLLRRNNVTEIMTGQYLLYMIND